MDPEYYLPYEGDLQTALLKGNNRAVEEILYWRNHDDVSFSLPRIEGTQRICEVEIIFLDGGGIPQSELCGKVDILNANLATSNNFFVKNIPLKKLLDDSYILEDDGKLISKSKKLVGIPICKDVYSLVEKGDYDENFVKIYYSLYVRLHWKLKGRSSDVSYANFQGTPEREIVAQIQNLVRYHGSRDEAFDDYEEAESDDSAGPE